MAVCTIGGCSYVVEFDRSLLMDAGTDGEADAESQPLSEEDTTEAEATDAPTTAPDAG